MEAQGVSRLSATMAIAEAIEIRKKQIVRLEALHEFLRVNQAPTDVEELIWSMVTTNRGSYYI